MIIKTPGNCKFIGGVSLAGYMASVPLAVTFIVVLVAFKILQQLLLL